MGTQRRVYPYSALTGTPTIPGPQEQADYDETDTASPSFIRNKPTTIGYSTTGTNTSVADIPHPDSAVVIITPSQTLRDAAEEHNAKVHLALAVHWRTKAVPAAPQPVATMRIVVENQIGTQRYATPIGESYTLERGDYQTVSIGATMEPGDTRYEVSLDRADGSVVTTSIVEVESVSWRLTLSDEAPLEPGEGIAIDSGRITLADDGVTQDKLDFEGTPQQGQEVFIDSGGKLGAGYRFVPEEVTSNSGLRMALVSGTPTLATARTQTYTADIAASGTARTGRVLIVRVADGTDTKGYVVIVGEPPNSQSGTTTERFQIDDMTELGTAATFTYYRSDGLTVPANEEVDFYLMSNYAAEQVVDLYAHGGGTTGGGGTGTLTDVTASAPLNASGTGATRNISLPDDSLTAAKLEADTETEKQTFRDRIGSTPINVQTLASFAATSSNPNYTIEINLPTSMTNAAAGRPYEVDFMGTIRQRAAGTTVTVRIWIASMASAGGTVYGETSVSSVGDPATAYTVTALLPPATTSFHVGFTATTATSTATYDGTGTIRTTTGVQGSRVYIDASGFDGNLATSDDTAQELAQKVDDLTVSGGGGAIPDNSIVPDKLQATTEQQKLDFRTKLETTEIHVNIFTDFSATPSARHREFAVPLSTLFQEHFDGRPYQMEITGTLVQRTEGTAVGVDVELRSAASGGGTLYKEQQVTSTGAPPTDIAFDVMVPPNQATVYLLFRNTTAASTATYDVADMKARIVKGTLAADTYVDTTGFTGGVLFPSDNTVQKVINVLNAGPPSRSILPAALRSTSAAEQNAFRTRIGINFVESTRATPSGTMQTSGATAATLAITVPAFQQNVELDYSYYRMVVDATASMTSGTGTARLTFTPTGSSTTYTLADSISLTSTATSRPAVGSHGSVSFTNASTLTGTLTLTRLTGTGNARLSSITVHTDQPRQHIHPSNFNNGQPGFGDDLTWSPAFTRIQTDDTFPNTSAYSLIASGTRYMRWGDLVYYWGNLRFRRAQVPANHTGSWVYDASLPYLPSGRTVRNYQGGVLSPNQAFDHYQVFTQSNLLRIVMDPTTSGTTTSDSGNYQDMWCIVSGWYRLRQQ